MSLGGFRIQLDTRAITLQGLFSAARNMIEHVVPFTTRIYPNCLNVHYNSRIACLQSFPLQGSGDPSESGICRASRIFADVSNKHCARLEMAMSNLFVGIAKGTQRKEIGEYSLT